MFLRKGFGMTDVALMIGDSEIELAHPLESLVEFDQLMVVLLRVPADSDTAGNIYAYDRDGQLEWRIHGSADSDALVEGSRFTKMSREGDELLAMDTEGDVFRVRLDCGELEPRPGRLL